MAGSRADWVVHFTWLMTLLAPIVSIASFRLARRGNRERHRLIQVGLLSLCWTSVLALELKIRLSGGSGSFVGLAPIEWQPFARRLLLVHVGVAVLTYGAWTALAVMSWRRFRATLPGGFSSLHRRAGWSIFGGLCFTSASASAMYLLAFVL